MQIPFIDLHVQYQEIKQDVQAALAHVLENMQLFLGPETAAFEREYAAYCGCQEGIGVSNGTDAIILALRSCGIGPGDEVITVANTFIATVEAVAAVGAIPVFVDIDSDTYTMDCNELAQVLTPRTRAVIPVHLYGHPVDMRPVLEFAQAHDLKVIEDASQAHGATYEGRRVGSLGDIGCFSFYCSKNLGAYGEAGICITSNGEFAEKIRLLRDHGSSIRYQHRVLGTNARMDEIQAALLRVKLHYLEQWNAARQRHAQFYTEHLQGVVESVPIVRPRVCHVYYAYVVRVRERDQFRQLLQQAGVASGIHYPVPIHLQPACEHYGYRSGSLPVTEAAARCIVSLPMYPEMTTLQAQAVVNAVKQSTLLATT
jgi:dTDP-4-amino-4,6-dideoxygalactose transaminase